MAIGAIMNVPPSEIGDLSWHDFQSLCWHYNQLNSTDDEQPEAISIADYEREIEKMARIGMA